ncbi:NACHT domain-containing protein [Streptomyces sp. NPDC046887]|uniref:NACHT domain-containing protein n=1 Tax=Streptomyces sp. NPDC046887 TaxID=3155472 RepID=UPI0033E0376F
MLSNEATTSWLTAAAGAAGGVASVVMRRLGSSAGGLRQQYLAHVEVVSRRLLKLVPEASGKHAVPGDGLPVAPDVVVDDSTIRTPITKALGRDDKPKAFLLVGGPGAGKTSLAVRLALKAARGELGSRRSIPVLLGLRDHAEDFLHGPHVTLPGLVAAQLAHLPGGMPGRAEGWLERMLGQGRCLVILDGLDEITDPVRQQYVSRWIDGQLRRYPRNDFVITSRPPAHRLIGTGITGVLTVQSLSDQQITEFLEQWSRSAEGLLWYPVTRHRVIADGLLEELRGRPDVLELVRNPAALALVARGLGRDRRLPDNPLTLSGALVDALLSRRWVHEGPGPLKLTPEQKKRIIQVLALEMTEAERDEATSAEAGRAIGQVLSRSDPSGSAQSEQFLHLMVQDGLLVQRSEHVYAFAHRSFQHVLTATQIRAQGTVRLLVEHLEDARWRGIILAWASEADASPVIEACLALGTSTALALAGACAQTSPRVDPELRSALARTDRGGPAGTRRNALTALVEKEHSDTAAELLRRARDEQRPVSRDDVAAVLAGADDRPAGEWSMAEASAFLSAAVLAAEAGGRPEATRHRFSGLLALAYAVRAQSVESSRSLCLAALRQLDPAPTDAEIRSAALVYLGGPAVPSDAAAFAGALRAHFRTEGPGACDLLVPLVATGRKAARLIGEALRRDADALRQVRDRLGTDTVALRSGAAWDPAVDAWHRARRRLAHQLGALTDLRLEKDSLVDCTERVASRLAEGAPRTLELEGIARALGQLTDFLERRRFDERDAALRAAGRHAALVRASVRDAPTELSAELSEPAAARIEFLAAAEREKLAARHPPRPRLDAALPKARLLGRTATVDVEVGNPDERSAPLESAWIEAAAVTGVYTPREERIALPRAVEGGTAVTVQVLLDLTEAAAQEAVVLHVHLRLGHRPRRTDKDALVRRRLTVELDRSHEPVDPNPFAAGALGRPVGDSEMLFGRDELIRRVRTRLTTASTPGAGIVLFGQKRTGKSSVRLELARRLYEQDGHPVVDVGNLGELTPMGREDGRRLLGTLLWRILDGADKAPGSGARLVPEGFDRQRLIDSPDPVADCTELFVRQGAARPGRPPLVVFIDEFQYMEQWMRDGLVPPSFMRMFKAIIERRLFHLVLVGQSQVERLVEDDPNAFGVFGLERVTCLAEPDARALMQRPVLLATAEGQVSRYHPRALAEIVRLTGGNPYYVQRFCCALIDHMNKEHAAQVTDADVRRVTGQLLDDLRAADFDGLESPEGGDPRWTGPALRACLVAAAGACRGGHATWEAIQQRHEGPLSRELLDHLVSREVVRRAGDTYQFVVGLYEAWLRLYHVHPEGSL